MWVSSIRVRGLVGAVSRELQQVDRLEDPVGPTVDAFRLLAAGLDRARVPDVLRALGWTSGRVAPEIPGQADIDRPWAVRACLEPGPRPQITVEAVIEVDPPLFGRLRDAVIRDPQLAEGLGEGVITVRVGWMFTSDLTAVSVDRGGLALGGVAVPLGDPPPWADALLTDLGKRFVVLDEEPEGDVAARLADALLGPDPARRSGARAALDALAGFPDGPIELVCAPDGVRFGMGPSLRPLRWAHPDALLHARLVDAVHLGQPDVLVVPRGLTPAVDAWLVSCSQGDDARIEQSIACAVRP